MCKKQWKFCVIFLWLLIHCSTNYAILADEITKIRGKFIKANTCTGDAWNRVVGDWSNLDYLLSPALFHSPLESIIEEAWGQYPLKARRCVGLLLIKIVSFKVNLNYYQMINNVNMTFMSCWQFWDDCNIISLTYNLKYNLACNTSCFRDQPSIIALYQSWIII